VATRLSKVKLLQNYWDKLLGTIWDAAKKLQDKDLIKVLR
jgi:hypothetical protein